MKELLIVRTGTANLASVIAAFHRLGVSPEMTHDPDAVLSAERVVLPGVGAFGAAMSSLAANGLDAALVERVKAGGPTLGICLGMQLLFASSGESPGRSGLNIVQEGIGAFPGGVRTPHFGWNEVEPSPECRLLTGGYAYFANSFRAVAADRTWAWATTEHGGSFVSAIERGPVLACQFHPELSGRWGLDLLGRWLAA